MSGGGATGAFRGLARGLSATGLLVEAVGTLQGDDDIAAAGRKVRQAAREVPEIQREAATALPGLGREIGGMFGQTLFSALTREDEP